MPRYKMLIEVDGFVDVDGDIAQATEEVNVTLAEMVATEEECIVARLVSIVKVED